MRPKIKSTLQPRAVTINIRSFKQDVYKRQVFICAYLAGAVGLLYTTAGNQSFIISMSVVFVPLSVWLFTRKFPGWHVAAAVVLCTAGIRADASNILQ